MNKNKIEEILKKAAPPPDIDSEKKYQLRRELLNSKHFEKKNLLHFLLRPKLILAGIFILLVAVLTVVNFNKKVTIDELRKKVNSQYAGFINGANFSSFENDLTLFGFDDKKINLKVGQVIDPATNNFYIKIYDEQKLEELDKLVIKNKNVYRSENPKIKTVGTVSSLSNKTLQVFIIDDSAQTEGDLTFLNKGKYIDKFIPHSPSKGYIAYNKPVKMNEEISRYKLEPFYHEVPKEVDLDKYFRTNPIDLASELSTAENIEVVGTEYDLNNSKEYQLVQITKEIDHNVVAAYKVILSKIDSLSSYDIEINSADSITRFSLDKKTNWSSIDSDSLASYKELKTISLSSSSGEIKKVRFAILKDEQIINLSEIRFTEQSQVKADTSYFDYKKHNLVFVGKLN